MSTPDDTEEALSGPKVLRRDRLTLTQSCAEALAEAIELGTYRPGSRLPSEAELAEQLEVSRPTLRESLRLLEERGLIRRQHGRGTFVLERRIQKDLNRNFGITSMIRAAGYTPSARGSVAVSDIATKDVAERLGLIVGVPLWRVERTRLADARPVLFSIDTFSQRLLTGDDLSAVISGKDQSVYSLFYKVRGIVIYRGEAELVPCKATGALREALETKQGAPLLCIKQVDYDQHGRAVLYSVEYHVADWVRFTLERMGPGIATMDM
jgi:GntR family transcriptional regulator